MAQTKSLFDLDPLLRSFFVYTNDRASLSRRLSHNPTSFSASVTQAIRKLTGLQC
jgi:hypothetical protein